MFFGNSRLRFSKLFCSIVNTKERTNTTKENTINIVQCSSVKITFRLFKCYRCIDNSNDFHLFILS